MKVILGNILLMEYALILCKGHLSEYRHHAKKKQKRDFLSLPSFFSFLLRVNVHFSGIEPMAAYIRNWTHWAIPIFWKWIFFYWRLPFFNANLYVAVCFIIQVFSNFLVVYALASVLGLTYALYIMKWFRFLWSPILQWELAM